MSLVLGRALSEYVKNAAAHTIGYDDIGIDVNIGSRQWIQLVHLCNPRLELCDCALRRLRRETPNLEFLLLSWCRSSRHSRHSLVPANWCCGVTNGKSDAFAQRFEGACGSTHG